MKWLSSWWVRLQRSAWPIAALVLLSIQALLTLAPIRGESTHVLVDYSPLLFVATAVAILNAAEPARNAVLFWSLLSAATRLAACLKMPIHCNFNFKKTRLSEGRQRRRVNARRR
jgi:hypothetical protein